MTDPYAWTERSLRFTYWDFANFLSNNSTNTWNGLSSSPPSQTCNKHIHKRPGLLPELRLMSSSQLRHSGVSGTPSLSSAWRCTRTCPFPPWPSSWQWDQCLGSVAASAPHLRLASVKRMYLKPLMHPFMERTLWDYVIHKWIIYLLFGHPQVKGKMSQKKLQFEMFPDSIL